MVQCVFKLTFDLVELCRKVADIFVCLHRFLYDIRFMMYELPKYKKGEAGSGVDYMYLDPSVLDWQLSRYAVNMSEGAVGRTLSQLYHRYEV